MCRSRPKQLALFLCINCYEMKTEVGSFHVGQLNVFGGWVGRQLDADFGSSGQAGFKIVNYVNVKELDIEKVKFGPQGRDGGCGAPHEDLWHCGQTPQHLHPHNWWPSMVWRPRCGQRSCSRQGILATTCAHWPVYQ